MNKKNHPLLFAAVICLFSVSLLPNIVCAQGNDWKVWVKTSPCSGRYDWISVAKTDPTGGGNYFSPANMIFPGTTCTNQGCSYADAMAVAATLRPSSRFSSYCCHEYSVWKNNTTGKMSVVVGKFGNAGFGWIEVKGNLCCEEAEALAGIPGACSGTTNNKQTNVACWPGSYAAYNPQTHRTECFCNTGLVWNSTHTACIEPTQSNTDCSMYPGSYAAWNSQTQRMECWCPTGKVWNSTKTACVDKTTEVACWPGSYAAYNPQTQRTECFCNAGLVWNSTKTACVDPTNNNGDNGKTNNNNKNNNGGTATWTLVSVTVSPEKNQYYTYNAQGSSVHLELNNGDKADFQWTKPPQQFGMSGFTINVSVQANPKPPNVMSALIGVGSSDMTQNPSDGSAHAYPPTGPASAQKSVTFTPSAGSSDIEVKVVVSWGSVNYSYKYKRN